jgi:organic radical activating enzyme
MAAVYFHIPFCKKACHYCNFHFSTSIKNKASILDAMLSELKIRKLELKSDYVINSIYFGGGTPSLLSANEIEILINSVRDSYVVSESVEITLEMNPDDYRPNYLFELFQNSDHTWVEYALDENSSEQENSDEKDAENENEEIYFLNVMSSMSLYTHKQNTFIEQHAFFDIVLKTYFPPPEIS